MKTLRSRTLVATLLAAVLLLAGALPDLVAQETPTATPLEMRHFWHVFIAYALAWVIVFGWVLSILRRIRRVEDKLN